MIPDLCTWAYDLAVSWLPPLALLWGGASDEGETEASGARATDDEPTPGPATTEALARAREALAQIDREAAPTSRRLDARFRAAPGPSLLGAGAGIHRLVGRLEEIDVDQLAAEDRKALMGAASGLLARLRESMV